MRLASDIVRCSNFCRSDRANEHVAFIARQHTSSSYNLDRYWPIATGAKWKLSDHTGHRQARPKHCSIPARSPWRRRSRPRKRKSTDLPLWCVAFPTKRWPKARSEGSQSIRPHAKRFDLPPAPSGPGHRTTNAGSGCGFNVGADGLRNQIDLVGLDTAGVEIEPALFCQIIANADCRISSRKSVR